jgi:DNA-binding PadR family transcriptional regulator
MSPKRAKATGKPRGAQALVLAELRSLGPKVRLSTAEIAKRIASAGRKTFHPNSVYNALRILVRRGTLTVARKGRQKVYQLSNLVRAGRRRLPLAGASRTRRTSSHKEPPAAALPHKLALGEILVIRIGERDVVTATNLHGRLVLERHHVPT